MAMPPATDDVPSTGGFTADGGRESRVLVPCPRTGIRLDTGLRMSDTRFRRFDPRNARVFCPGCATSHRWTRVDAELEDGARP